MRRSRSKSTRAPSGFTLLEILVALAVVTIALGAIIAETSRNIANADRLREKTLAHWVAMNKIAEAQLSKDWPSAGSRSGSTLMAEQDWYWTLKVSTTEDKSVRRLDIEVRADQADDHPLLTLIAYVGEPMK